jgi:signal transduction histidine kinase
MGIRERAEILGGVATVESEPGQGTHVVVRVPLPREVAKAGGPQDGAVAEVTADPGTSDAPRSGAREGAT